MSNYYVMEYLYRDANNFKAFGQLLLSNNLTDRNLVDIKLFLEFGEFFVAEQVSIPTLYSQLWKYSNGPTTADHAFHEFLELRIASDEDVSSLEVWGSVDTLLAVFHDASQQWDCRKSIHCMNA
jgi:hypothetical protein